DRPHPPPRVHQERPRQLRLLLPGHPVRLRHLLEFVEEHRPVDADARHELLRLRRIVFHRDQHQPHLGMLDRQRLQAREPLDARLAPRCPEGDQQRLKEWRPTKTVERQHFALREIPPPERGRGAADLRAPALEKSDGGDGRSSEEQREQHVHSSIKMVPLSASRTAASTACAVTLSHASLRALSRSLGWIPRTVATVAAPEAPPEQDWATRRTTTSHRSPRAASAAAVPKTPASCSPRAWRAFSAAARKLARSALIDAPSSRSVAARSRTA